MPQKSVISLLTGVRISKSCLPECILTVSCLEVMLTVLVFMQFVFTNKWPDCRGLIEVWWKTTDINRTVVCVCVWRTAGCIFCDLILSTRYSEFVLYSSNCATCKMLRKKRHWNVSQRGRETLGWHLKLFQDSVLVYDIHTHLHLVQRLRISSPLPLLPMLVWHWKGYFRVVFSLTVWRLTTHIWVIPHR